MPKLSAKALVSALPYALKANFDELQYRVFMSDYLWNAVIALTHTKERPTRYFEIIHPPKEETRTAEEIIEHMKNKLREVK